MEKSKNKVLPLLPTVLSVSIGFWMASTQFLFAQGLTLPNPLSTVYTFPDFINALLDIVIQIAIPVIVIFIIYSGFLFVTARGDTEQIKRARATFVAVIIGSAIILGAKVLAAAIAGTINAL